MTDDSLFVPDPNNRRLYQFSTSCSECQMLAKAARNWDKGLEFQKISKKTLNTLLSYILDLLKQVSRDAHLSLMCWHSVISDKH